MKQGAEPTDRREAPAPGRELSALREIPEFRGPIEPLDDHDHSNDHLALIYETRDEQFDAVVPFLREGLERGERCLYVADQRAREAVLAAMRDRGVDADAAVESGALTVLTPSETYRRTGKFDRDATLSFWEDALGEAKRDEGYEGIRAAAEMTWALDDTDFDRLVEYEAVLNDLYEGEDYAVMCQYDRERFPASVVRDVVETHPHIVSGDTVSRNFYYTPPEEFFAPEDPEREVDRMVQTLQAHTRAKSELREHRRYLRNLYEITADAERSFDEKVDRLLDLGCERFGLDLGFFLERDADQFRVVKTRGTDLEEGVATLSACSGQYCKQTITVEEPVGVEDAAAAGWDDDPLYREHGLDCYIGTRVTDGDDVYGLLCFADGSAREGEFTDAEYAFLDLMGQWLSYELERERREGELQRSKEHFERIFESSHDAIYIIDPYADEMLDVNPAVCEMLGHSREEILTKRPSEFHPDEMSQFREFVERVYEEGTGWTDELTCLRSDARRISVEMSASRLDYDGRSAMLAIVRDISERKEHERFQRRLYDVAADPDRSFDEKLQEMLDMGCERFGTELGGVARVDPDTDLFEVETTNSDHEHLAPGERYPLSETYCRLLTDDGETAGVTDPAPEEYEGRLCYDRFGVRTYLGTYLEVDGDVDRTFWFLSNESRDEPFTESERTFHRLMGQWVRYELERKQYEDELEGTVERLRQSNERLEHFAYAASHDLQEPLRMVSSYLQLIENRYEEDLDADAREFLGFAVDGANRMKDMIEGLLEYSRIETRGEPFEAIELDAVLDDVRSDLQLQIAESGADVDAGELPRVWGDESQLNQLFQNLLSNAIEYSGDEPPRVRVSAEREGGRWVVSVSDEGIGMDLDDSDRIFEVFQRLHGREEYEGTGIGLALCKRIAERHGGDIWVDSTPGEGTTFSFSLPDFQSDSSAE